MNITVDPVHMDLCRKLEKAKKALSKRDALLAELRYYLDQMVDREAKLTTRSDKIYRMAMITAIDRLRAGKKK